MYNMTFAAVVSEKNVGLRHMCPSFKHHKNQVERSRGETENAGKSRQIHDREN